MNSYRENNYNTEVATFLEFRILLAGDLFMTVLLNNPEYRKT